MMKRLIIDTNILIDVTSDHLRFRDSSCVALEAAIRGSGAMINDVIWAEFSAPFADRAVFEQTVIDLNLEHQRIPADAWFIAAKVHLHYRQRGGAKQRILPDFIIGAHAKVIGAPILTRDTRPFEIYFPDVTLIMP
jgi:predicted nucleic acid-binding protein